MTKRKKLKTYDKQRDAVEEYRKRNPQAPIGTTFAKPEKEYIQDIFKAHGVKLAEIIRGAAAALADGQIIRTEREPLTIPPEYQTPTDAQAENDNTNAEEMPTT